MNVLVSGGAGYIGSHACLSLLEAGHQVTIVDNLDLGHRGAVRVLESMAADRVRFERCDIQERSRIETLMREQGIEVVMHFAALANVGDSVVDPLTYYRNNTAGAIALLEACHGAGVERFVFSSTCATYGEPDADSIPISEDCPQNPVNPYGRSKLMVEQVLADEARSARDAGRPFAFAALRYFNVAGADPGNRLGEDHSPETHLLPIALQVALGKRDSISIFGTDYPTADGTCIRDYVHVTDLVRAHLMVMDALQPGDQRHYNIGIGRGYSVRECIEACRRVTGHPIPEVAGPKRAGDPPELTADPKKIHRELGFEARHTELDEIIRTAWDWFQSHPEGYGD